MNSLKRYLQSTSVDTLNSYLQGVAQDAVQDLSANSNGHQIIGGRSGSGKDVGNVDLKAHDARFHPNGFDPSKDHCSLREKMSGGAGGSKNEPTTKEDSGSSTPQKVDTGVAGVGIINAANVSEADAAKKLAEMAKNGDTKAWQALKEANRRNEYVQQYGENNADYEMNRQQQSSEKTNGEMAVQKEISDYHLKPPLDKESIISKMSKMGQLKTPGAKTAAQNYIDSLNRKSAQNSILAQKGLPPLPDGLELHIPGKNPDGSVSTTNAGAYQGDVFSKLNNSTLFGTRNEYGNGNQWYDLQGVDFDSPDMSNGWVKRDDNPMNLFDKPTSRPPKGVVPPKGNGWRWNGFEFEKEEMNPEQQLGGPILPKVKKTHPGYRKRTMAEYQQDRRNMSSARKRVGEQNESSVYKPNWWR